MKLPITSAYCQIIGFGPAAVSLIIAADRCGILTNLLKKGLVIHDKAKNQAQLLHTGINYDIPSNSDAVDFISGLSDSGLLAPVLNMPATSLLIASQHKAVSLQLVALFINEVREYFSSLIEKYPKSEIRYDSQVLKLEHKNPWQLFSSTGRIDSPYIIVATGSRPYTPEPISHYCHQRRIPLDHSEYVLRNPAQMLFDQPNRGATVIVGGSHSTFSVLDRLLNQETGCAQQIKLLHIEPIKRMHLSIESAVEAKEKFDMIEDVCPESGRVFRFQGLYKRSRRLYEDVRKQLYPNVSLHFCQSSQEILNHLEGAANVIATTGYRSQLPKLFDDSGDRIMYRYKGSTLTLDKQARICRTNHKALNGLMAIGLGYGRTENTIGEPSFEGAPIGINIFQHAEGEVICEQLM